MGLADAIERKGAPIVIRRVSSSAGAVPLLNPPLFAGPVTIGAAAAIGATAIELDMARVSGRLLPGDCLQVGTLAPIVVAAAAPARPVTQPGPPGFSAVPVQPLLAPIAAGAAVQLAFAADLATFAMVQSFPVRLIDGERIRSRDLALKISAQLLPDLLPTWSVILNGREMSVVGATPYYERGDVVAWDVQAR